MVFSQHRVLHSILSAVRELGRTVGFFKVLLQEKVQQLDVELMSVVEVFRALSQDRVQQLVVIGGYGFIESSAEAQFGDAAFAGFRVPVSWQGHFAVDASVTFSVQMGPDGFMEALTLSQLDLAVSCAVSARPLVRQWIQYTRQTWWLLVFFTLSSCWWTGS